MEPDGDSYRPKAMGYVLSKLSVHTTIRTPLPCFMLLVVLLLSGLIRTGNDRYVCMSSFFSLSSMGVYLHGWIVVITETSNILYPLRNSLSRMSN
ncbi:hypothetical protein F4809DRAFT_626826 [Biscogniauxia mediterranea]|nr:hypothetical protein F4809DRAFT_626826 [Biscogniauxia mediterranea]